MIRAAVVALVAALILWAAAPATAEEDVVRLRVTAVFNQPTFVSTDEDIRVTLTVENIGTVTANDVDVLMETDLNADPGELGELNPGAGTVRLEPDEDVTAEVAVLPPLPAVLRLEFEAVAVGQRQDDTDRQHVAVVEAPMTIEYGSLSGLVYGDLDGDGVVDPDEELVGGTIELDGGLAGGFVSTRVKADGVFAFADLPAGDYYVAYDPPSGWQQADPWQVHVGPGANTVVVRAVRTRAPVLTASVALDRDTYAVGDVARERVVLTNTGTTPLNHVMASCGGEGDNGLHGRTWGDLSSDTDIGITLAPGERRTFDFAEVVPAAGGEYGSIELSCVFLVDWRPGPSTAARAAVPGLVGSRTGTLLEPPNRPVPNVPILLVDNDSGRTVARAVTAGDGRFRFADVPAGRYEVRFAGPWRHAANPVEYLQVRGGKTVDQVMYVVPGPSMAEPTVNAVPPHPQASPRPATLADTGASVRELAVLGVLLLLAGSTLLLFRRQDVH